MSTPNLASWIPRAIGLTPALLTLLLTLPVPPLGAQTPPTEDATTDPILELRGEMRRLIVEARDRVFPALVHIEATTVRFSEGREIKGRSGGSGAIVSEDGHVVTNHHVAENGSGFLCTLADKRQVPAELVGSDPLTDLAVLRLDLDRLEPGAPLQVAEFGDSSRLEVGDYVLAMGSPFTLSRSVSLGIVSNTERVFGPGVGGGDLGGIELEVGQRTGLFTRWIQHDAALNPGNSGGPLVNLEGKIVGVNQLGGDQVGFAIPANLARGVVAALIAQGRVPRSWIGVAFKPLTGSGIDRGVLVSSVVLGGPADRAGLEVGDVLIRLDDVPLEVRHLEEVPDLLARIAGYPIGRTLALEVSRGTPDGEQVASLEVTTEEWPEDRGDRRALGEWGLTVQELTEKTVADYLLSTAEGVLVTGVRPGGPAALAEPSLDPGDVIVEIQGHPTPDLDRLVRAYSQVVEADPPTRRALLRIDRRGQSLLSVLTVREEPPPPRVVEVAKAWLGVVTQPITEDLASLLGHPDLRGLRITRVHTGTRAAEAGLEVGDVIRTLDEEPLTPRGRQDTDLLARLLRRREIGDTITLGLLRDGEPHEVEVELEAARTAPVATPRLHSEDLEMTVREVTLYDRDEYRWSPAVDGVLVEEVEAAGRARLAGLRPRDLVQKVGSHPVHDLASYREALERLEQERPETVRVIVRRGARTFLNYVRPNW